MNTTEQLQTLEAEYNTRRAEILRIQQQAQADIAAIELDATRQARAERERQDAETRQAFEAYLTQWGNRLSSLQQPAMAFAADCAQVGRYLEDLRNRAGLMQVAINELLAELKYQAQAHQSGYASSPTHQDAMNRLVSRAIADVAALPVVSTLDPAINKLYALPGAEELARAAFYRQVWNRLVTTFEITGGDL